MALDMKLSKSSLTSEIQHDEERYLMLIEAHDLPCPTLYRIWEQFYDGPRIYHTDSALIVEELTAIDRFIRSQRPESINATKWAATFAKLTKFFAEASKTNSTVQCISD
jgi:hypothetical protein